VKAVFHWIWTAPIALVSGLVLCVLFKLGILFILLLLLSILVFPVFFALLGLFINLKMPRLHWTSEMACVKQSFSAILSLFSGWLTCGVLVGGYFWFGKYLPTWGYFLVGIGLLLILTAVLCVWLVKRGTKIFEKLA
jgi:ABC-2 type transport system permease protein